MALPATQRTAIASDDKLRETAERTAVAESPAASSGLAPAASAGEAGPSGGRGALLAAARLALEAALERARTKHRLQTQRLTETRALLAAARARSERAYLALCKAVAGRPARPGAAPWEAIRSPTPPVGSAGPAAGPHGRGHNSATAGTGAVSGSE